MGRRRGLRRDVLGVLYLCAGDISEASLRAVLARVRGETPGDALRVTVHRLRSDRLAVRHGRGAGAKLRLTRAGAARAGLPPPTSLAPRAPDGLMYFVTYDIPESERESRDQFRDALRLAGWRRLHRSMWVADRDIRDTAVEAADRFAVQPYVFIGTGALVKALQRRQPEVFVSEAVREARAIAAMADRDPGKVFHRWVDLTDRLRHPALSSRMEAKPRHLWQVATGAMRRSLSSLFP